MYLVLNPVGHITPVSYKALTLGLILLCPIVGYETWSSHREETFTALLWHVPVCCLMEGHLAAGNHLTD